MKAHQGRKSASQLQGVMNKALGLCLATGVLLSALSAEAASVKFPEDELAQEAVLPVFDEKIAIKSRRVNHAERFEVNLFGSAVLSEPIYTPYNFGVSLTYHFDNTSGVHFMGSFFPDGLSSNGDKLRRGDVIPISGGTKYFDASRAPHKNIMLAAHYQHTAYYGKISITKQTVMNLSLYGLLGGGAYLMDGMIAPMINLGFGQRFYLTPSVAFRLDLLLSSYYGVDITSTADATNPSDRLDNSAPAPKVDASKFDKKLLFDTQILLGFSFLI